MDYKYTNLWEYWREFYGTDFDYRSFLFLINSQFIAIHTLTSYFYVLKISDSFFVKGRWWVFFEDRSKETFPLKVLSELTKIEK